MKPAFAALLFIMMLANSSCKKNDSLADLFVGRWQMVATIGAGVADPKTNNLYVRFNDDGALSGTAFSNYTNYKVNTSAGTIAFTGPGPSMIYTYSFQNNQLTLKIPGTSADNYQTFEKVP